VDGALALDAVWLFAAFLILLILAASGIAARRFLLERGGGTVECGLRRLSGNRAWRLGVASYQRDELRWYHVFGILLRPEEIFPRRTLVVISRRLPEPSEEANFGPGRVVVECRAGDDGGYVELAMTESALTGFLAWLEAAPPGSHLDQIA
jgi:Protein of unknown function (DUF2550)